MRCTSYELGYFSTVRILNHFFVSRKIAQLNRQKFYCFVLNFFDIVTI